jgi:hypothetical protein
VTSLIGNLFRSTVELGNTGFSGIERDGLASESAAVVPGVLAHDRPASPCLPGEEWLNRGLLCRKLHCPPRQDQPERKPLTSLSLLAQRRNLISVKQPTWAAECM